MQTLSSKEFAEMFFKLQEEMHKDPEKHQGVRTGIPELDKLTGGLHYGWYIVIGGPQKSGKSAFLVSLAKMFGSAGVSFYYSGYEMSNMQMAARTFANVGGISTQKFRDIKLDESDWRIMTETRDTIAKWGGWWNYGASELSVLLREIEQYKPRVVICDYVNLMSDREHTRHGKQAEMEHISHTLKQLTLSAEEPRMIITAAQLNREGNKGKFFDSAEYFRDSGAFAQDADLAMVIAPVIDPTGEEDQTLRKIHIVAARWAEKETFLVKFIGERSLVAGSEVQLVNLTQKLKEADERVGKNKNGRSQPKQDDLGLGGLDLDNDSGNNDDPW